METTSLVRDKSRTLWQVLFNRYGTHLPSRRLRRAWLRAMGATLEPGVSIFGGTTVLGPHRLHVGARTNVGWRCVLDARGGLTIGRDVVIASDSQLITGSHDLESGRFDNRFTPIAVEDHAWLATRSMVLGGVCIGRGAVVAAGAVVTADVPPLAVVAGVPARAIKTRPDRLDYRLRYDPPLH